MTELLERASIGLILGAIFGLLSWMIFSTKPPWVRYWLPRVFLAVAMLALLATLLW
jgi:hypothetical protein